MEKLNAIEAVCRHALNVLENDGEYHAEDLADQILIIVCGLT